MKKVTTRPALSPWGKIVRAGKNLTGLRLTREEVLTLAEDEAIMIVGERDLEVWKKRG